MNTELSARSRAPAATELESQQYLTFLLDGEMYAIGILNIKEIIEYGNLTMVPMMPAFIRGVINLRGSVVPVIDLRVRFGGYAPPPDRLTVIVVVALGSRYVGLVADDVSRVLSIESGALQPSPQLAQHIDISFVSGLLRDGESLVTLLDVERLIADDLGAVR